AQISREKNCAARGQLGHKRVWSFWVKAVNPVKKGPLERLLHREISGSRLTRNVRITVAVHGYGTCNIIRFSVQKLYEGDPWINDERPLAIITRQRKCSAIVI